jgi:hypothetical protein
MAWLLNLVIPGSGLIVQRREWLGGSLAVIFGICGNLALAGWSIAPAAIPTWLTIVAALLAGLTWLLAQILSWRLARTRHRVMTDLTVLLGHARAALERGETDSARVYLESSAALDEDNIDLAVLWARVLAMEGDEAGARRAWRRVQRLDPRRRRQEEAEADSADDLRSPNPTREPRG